MANVAGARFLVTGGEVRANNLLQFAEQLVERYPLANSKVDDLSDSFSGFSCAQVRINHISDVCEITRLLAVAINHRRIAVEKGRDEFRDHPGIWRRRVLPRPEDVEIAQ